MTARRVCHLRATNFFGGPEKQIVEHCLNLDPRRWEPSIATFREGGESTELSLQARERGIRSFEIAPRFALDPAADRGPLSAVTATTLDGGPRRRPTGGSGQRSPAVWRDPCRNGQQR